MSELGQPFSIPKIKNFVPEKTKPWVMIFFVILIQFSGGVYLSAVNQMVGSTALLQEDIMMAGSASLAGLAIFFPIMFRLEMAVQPKTTMYIVGTAIIIANIICMLTTSVPVLIITCFIAGFFRMWGTLECNSTIQLWLTPTRDLSVFFSYIYLVVNGMIQLSGIMTLYVTMFSTWRYVHLVVIGMMLVLLLVVTIIYQNKSLMPHLPLYGIDWIGMFMWAVIMLSTLFVLTYGEHYDWFDSWQIRFGTCLAVATLVLNRIRANIIRHPFIGPETFKFKVVWIVIGLYLVADTLLAPSHVFEPALMEGMMGYDETNLIVMNWIALAAVAVGAAFTYKTFAVSKWSYHRMIVLSFLCFAFYLAYFYFFIEYDMSKTLLAIPIFIRTFGYMIMAIVLLTAFSRLPFPDRFTQGIMIQNTFSASVASAFGVAVVERILRVKMAENGMLAGSVFDSVNRVSGAVPMGAIYGQVQQRALMVSMKEIYGILLIVCLICLVIFAIRRSDFNKTAANAIHPKWSTIGKSLKHQFRIRLKYRALKESGVDTDGLDLESIPDDRKAIVENQKKSQ